MWGCHSKLKTFGSSAFINTIPPCFIFFFFLMNVSLLSQGYCRMCAKMFFFNNKYKNTLVHYYCCCSQLSCLANCKTSGLDTWILYCNHTWLISYEVGIFKYLKVLTNVKVKRPIILFLFCSSRKLLLYQQCLGWIHLTAGLMTLVSRAQINL